MKRSVCIALAMTFALAGASAASAQKIKLANTIPAAGSATIPPAVKQECGVQTDLASAIARNSDKIELVEGTPKSGMRLEVTITEVHAPPGGMFSGPKWINATGNLKSGSKTLRSFNARRMSTGPFTGTCQTLDKVTNVMGQDIGGWLANDAAPSNLGDAQ